MTAVGSQSAKKRKKSVVVELSNESDGEIVAVAEKRLSQPYLERFDLYDPEHNPESYYAQNELPEFHNRNLERKINKQKAWLKPLPDSSKLFFAACTPTKVEDLAINPKIVGKVKLLILSNIMCGKIIFVTGPTGSGKSTAIDVVARSLNFDVLKWERDLQFEVRDGGGHFHLKEENEMISFLRFLRQTTLPPKPRRHKLPITAAGRLYHIEELPSLAYRDVVEFRRQICPLLRHRESKDFIVFDLTSRDSSWLWSPRRIFTKSFNKNLDIAEVEFYPIASTFMRKGLRRTMDSLGFHNRLLAQDYKAVERLANGDIRCGLNILQLSLLCCQKTFAIPNAFQTASTDELFHMLGALLYAKRENDGSRYLQEELGVREDLRRPPPMRHINDVLEMSKTSADTVMMFLHEHEPNFSGSIAATRKMLETLSFCDSMSIEWESRLLGQDLVSQVCARATMFYNYKANRIARGFYKYSRPKWFRLSNQIQTLKEELRDAMRLFGPANFHYGGTCLAYLSQLGSSLTSGQYRVVSYLNRPWNFTWETDRSLWDSKIASEPSYRMSQFRENNYADLILPFSPTADDSEDEDFTIEDSESDSDDSFNDPVTLD